jgi:hypothetical protein
MLAAIAVNTEKELPYDRWHESRVRRDTRDPAYTIAHMAVMAADELDLDALVIPTLSGRSVRLISANRPRVPIYALSPGRETVRRCGLMWGVQAASLPLVGLTAWQALIDIARLQAGQKVLETFLYDIAHVTPDWTPANIVDDSVAAVRAQDPGAARRHLHDHITGYYAETFAPEPSTPSPHPPKES